MWANSPETFIETFALHKYLNWSVDIALFLLSFCHVTLNMLLTAVLQTRIKAKLYFDTHVKLNDKERTRTLT